MKVARWGRRSQVYRVGSSQLTSPEDWPDSQAGLDASLWNGRVTMKLGEILVVDELSFFMESGLYERRNNRSDADRAFDAKKRMEKRALNAELAAGGARR